MEVRAVGSSSQAFSDWVAASDDAAIVACFRGLTGELEEQRSLETFHFKVLAGYDPRARRPLQRWDVVVFYGGPGGAGGDEEGPLTVARCMSCDLDTPLVLGVLGHVPAAGSGGASGAAGGGGSHAAGPTGAGQAAQPEGGPVDPAAAAPSSAPTMEAASAAPAGQGLPEVPDQAAEAPSGGAAQPRAAEPGHSGPTARDSLLHESEHMRCWFDAKARPMLVVTPKQHRERLSGLTDAELADLFRTAVDVLGRLGCGSFNSMVLNHGDRRNHAHLHLKVRVNQRAWAEAQAGWPPRWRDQYAALQAFAASLPAKKRGKREAFMLRQAKRQHAGGS